MTLYIISHIFKYFYILYIIVSNILIFVSKANAANLLRQRSIYYIILLLINLKPSTNICSLNFMVRVSVRLFDHLFNNIACEYII